MNALLVAVLALLAVQVAADCTVNPSANYPPQANCPADAILQSSATPGTCGAAHSWTFNYIANPIVSTGVNRQSRALLPNGASTNPHGWQSCVGSSCTPGGSIAVARNPAWNPSDINSKWISQSATAAATLGAVDVIEYTLTMSKANFDFAGVTLEHEGSTDNVFINVFCNGNAITLPIATFTNPTVLPFQDITSSNCPNLGIGTGNVVLRYRMQNTGGPTGVKINIQGNPTLRPNVVGYTDNCQQPTATQVSGLASGSVFPVGNTVNRYRVVDAIGGQTECTFNVRVVDDVDPVATCNAQTLTLNSAGVASLNPLAFLSGTDDCGIASGGISQQEFDCSDFGVTTVTGTITDTAGNSDGCFATVTVNDIPPNAFCRDVSLELDDNGEAFISPDDVDTGSFDNCGIGSRALSQTSFSYADVGSNTVTFTVTDVNGLTDSCTAEVFVEGSIFKGERERDVFMYLPQLFEWNRDPARSDSDVVTFFYESPSGAITIMTPPGGVPYGDLEFTYDSFHQELPDEVYEVNMLVNGSPLVTGEVLECTLRIPDHYWPV